MVYINRPKEKRICLKCNNEFMGWANKNFCCSRCSKQYYNKLNKEKVKMQEKIRKNRKREKDRKLALTLIGDKCVICNSTKKLIFHEKYGNRHNNETHPSFYLKHPENFITLCFDHHKLIHGLGETIDNIEQLNKAIEISKLLKN